MSKKINRMEEIIPILNEAVRVYEQENSEILTNFEYDKLYDELLLLEKETKTVLPNSPTQKAGYEILSELPKETHATPMLSLDKTKLVKVLEDFLSNNVGFLSWKLDGLTVVLTYKNGNLFKAVTRGNGEIGEVITENAKYFQGVPSKIDFMGDLVVRGEALIYYSDFEKINAEIEDVNSKYKNPRNLASGTVRQLNTRITKKRNVWFRGFQLIQADGFENNSFSERLNFLKTLGFNPVDGKKVTKETLANTIKEFSENVKENDFPSDGLVLMYDDVSYGLSLGNTSKYPRYGMAFKWKDETAQTTLREIEWSASRTGLLNPVAIFDPVELEGTTVSRASVHNISTIEQLKLGIGDKILCYKANMIIPQIASNITKSGRFNIPSTCPCCGEPTIIKQTELSKNVGVVKTLYCENQECPAKQIGAFEQFVSRDAMNIIGMSEATIERLVDEGLVKTFADIYTLRMRQEKLLKEREQLFIDMFAIHGININQDLLKDINEYSLISYMEECTFKDNLKEYANAHQNDLSYKEKMDSLMLSYAEIENQIIAKWDGMGVKSYTNLVDAIDKSRKVDIPKFIYALGIPNVGLSNAKLICAAFDYDINKIINATVTELISINGIGDIIADLFVKYFANRKNKDIVEELLQEITFNVVEKVDTNSIISGKTFVITGTLPTLDRKEAKEIVESKGGKVSGSVSKKTDYVLAGESAGSKLTKALELGIKVIDEDEFKNMIQ